VITQVVAQNYGPIKSAAATLTPLHAFIGPNDSGKSTLLRGIVTAVNHVAGQHPQFGASPESLVTIHVNEHWGYSWPGPITLGSSPARDWATRGARIARFDPDALRARSPLIPEQNALAFVDARGHGLPGVLDVLNNRNDESFQGISKELSRLFPTVDRLRLLTSSPNEKGVGVVLTNGREIDASLMSEGMLYYLAFAALRRLSGLALLAVEEPENGLHPSRIADVAKILREISLSGVQVIVATHSPLVVNELKPEEVSVVTRTAEEGTKVKRIIDTPNFQKRSKVYELGELWVSYANGLDEGPLLKGDPA
jgi:predicted ATPase